MRQEGHGPGRNVSYAEKGGPSASWEEETW